MEAVDNRFPDSISHQAVQMTPQTLSYRAPGNPQKIKGRPREPRKVEKECILENINLIFNISGTEPKQPVGVKFPNRSALLARDKGRFSGTEAYTLHGELKLRGTVPPIASKADHPRYQNATLIRDKPLDF